MLKKLRWMIIIPGILVGVSATLASSSDLTDGEIAAVEKDLFEVHTPPQDLAQKDYQSAEYKVTYLTNPSPLPEEQQSLLDSGNILSNRDWFLRRMEKTPVEEPAATWLRNKWLRDQKFKEPFSADVLAKYKPTPDFIKKEIENQKIRIKKAAKDYNVLVANLLEKRKTPPSGSVVEETSDNCTTGKFTMWTPRAPKTTLDNIPTTIAPAELARLSNDYFKIAHKQIADDTTAESQRQVNAAKNDSSYITPTTNVSATARAPLTLKFSTTADSAVGNGRSGTFTFQPNLGSRKIGAIKDPGEAPETSHPKQAAVSAPVSSPVRVSIPGVGGAQSFASIVNEPGSTKLYAVSQVGSEIDLFSSTDGQSWKLVNKISGISQGYSQNIHLAVSAGSQDIVLGTDQGAFVSSDQGATFNRIGDTGSQAVDVKLSGDGKLLLVGFKRPKSLSADGHPSAATADNVEVFGKNENGWTALPQQPKGLDEYSAQQALTEKASGHDRFSSNGVNLESVQFDPTHPGVVYAGAGNQLYRWDPAQQAWSELGSGVHDDSTVYNIDFDQNTGKLLMATCNGIYQGQAGASSPQFNKIGNGSFLWDQGPNGDGPFGIAVPSSSNSLRAYTVDVDPYDGNSIAAGASTGMYASKDGGISWNRIQGGDWQDKTPDGKTLSDVRTIVWTPDGSVVFSGSDGTFRATP